MFNTALEAVGQIKERIDLTASSFAGRCVFDWSVRVSLVGDYTIERHTLISERVGRRADSPRVLACYDLADWLTLSVSSSAETG